MNSYIRDFENQAVEILYDKENHKVLFRLEDVARAAGFAKVSSLRYHTKAKKREINIDGVLYLKSGSLNKIAKAATKTPGMKRFASWAVDLTGKIDIREINDKPIPAIKTPVDKAAEQLPKKKEDNSTWPFSSTIPLLYTISETANQVGMSVKEFSDWLVEEGYASRYASNNSIYFHLWFKENNLGTYPKIKDENGERTSRVPKITIKGLDYVKGRIESQRLSNVLSFAKKENFDKRKSEQEELERQVDELIMSKFKPYHHSAKYDHLLQPNKKEYRIDEQLLLKFVKEIISEVKLKELQQ